MAQIIQTNPKLGKPLDEKKLALLKAQEARDKMFKLVVKIISWETDSLNSIVVKSLDRISPTEWSNYKKYTLGISVQSVDKVKQKLAETYKNIKSHGGFK
ncbi:hypothetical protein HYS92_01060 [Candidatus Daviesbacteria bacterium]|nr:hypothetical protein [Candidatus Daviesbacteria bacterium]